MLAYVFWHWPKPDLAVADYEAHARTYQDALAADGPRELRAARMWHVEGAAWLPAGTGYEDWYLLDDSAALDILNRGAVAGPLGALHNAIASLVAGSVAGLYQATPGSLASLDGEAVCWFAKPAGMPYSDFYTRVGDAQSHLWRRMMVLGPTPEFCLQGSASDVSVIPADWQQSTVRRELVWPAPNRR